MTSTTALLGIDTLKSRIIGPLPRSVTHRVVKAGRPMRQSFVKTALDGHASLVGRAIQPAACFQQAFGIENKSRPEGGCRLITRPTFEAGGFTLSVCENSGADRSRWSRFYLISAGERNPKLTNLCENSLSCLWGGLFSRQPASSRLFRVENKSRPEGGCRLIARPTYKPGVFTQTLTSGVITP